MTEKIIQPKKYAYIDALRGIAALGIIVHHVPREYLNPKINAFLHLGSSGVPLFFILSAFTLFLSHNNRKNGHEKRPLFNFYIRRYFRIAPLFYAVLIYFIFTDGLGPRNLADANSAVNAYSILANITFTFGLHPYWISSVVHSGWSIGTEMLFYLIVPLLYRTIKSTHNALWFLFISLIFAKIATFTTYHILARFLSPLMVNSLQWKSFLYFFLPSQLPIFALGILLYFAISFFQNNTLSDKQLLPDKRSYSTPILCIFFLLLINQALHSFTTDGLIPSFVTTYALLYIPLIYALYLNPSKIFVNKVTTYLGKISYSLYLTHGIVLALINRYLPEFILGHGPLNYSLFLFITLATTVPLASITFALIEKPGQNFGQKLIEKLERKTVF